MSIVLLDDYRGRDVPPGCTPLMGARLIAYRAAEAAMLSAPADLPDDAYGVLVERVDQAAQALADAPAGGWPDLRAKRAVLADVKGRLAGLTDAESEGLAAALDADAARLAS